MGDQGHTIQWTSGSLKRPSLVLRQLKKLGFHAGPIDGIYGPQTAAAVQAFQIDRKLLVDGEVGAATAKKLKVRWY